MKRIIALTLMAMFVVALLGGCSEKGQTFTKKSYDTDETQVKEINIDVRDRQIEVSLSEDYQIHIAYSESEKEYYDISVSDEHVLTMTAAHNKEWKDFIGGKADADNRRVYLQIPDSLLTSLTLSTTNEDIRLSAINVTGDIELSSNGGDISFEKMNAGSSIALTAKNGHIKGSIVGGYDDYAIMCEVKKGESNLPSEKKDGDKKLSVQANNGDVEIDFSRS